MVTKMVVDSPKLVRYWGRKPPFMVSKYIEEFTKEGEVVLDPFAGSGNIVKVALELGRRAIYVDLNSFAKLIAEGTILGCDVEELKKVIDVIVQDEEIEVVTGEKKIKVSRKELFSIKCPCGEIAEVKSIIFTRFYMFNFEPEKATKLRRKVLEKIRESDFVTHEKLVEQLSDIQKNGVTNALKGLIKMGAVTEQVLPIEINYVKPCICGRTEINGFCEPEWLIEDPIRPAYWYPKTELRYPDGKPFLKKRDVERVHEFFDSRTLAFLSYLWHKINEINVSYTTKKCLHLIFMATLARSSKMNRPSGGTWPINSYWIPRKYVIRNPFYVFIRAANDLIHKLSSCQCKRKEGGNAEVLGKKADVAFLLDDAAKLSLPDNSVDYVITDPPHTDEAQFFELSTFYTSWMKEELDFEKEFVVNPRQGKDLKKYLDMYTRFVLEMRRVLKSSRYFTTILHEEDKTILEKCIEITKEAGFDLYKLDKIDNFHIITFVLPK